MKKFKLLSIFTIIIASLSFYNCSNDGENTEVTPENHNITSKGSGTLIVDSDETPEYSKEILEKLGFIKFNLDSKRDCKIDLNTNVVSLPYDNITSINKTPFTGRLHVAAIKIAKKNVKPGSGCSSCVDCTGFRCSFSAAEEISYSDWSAKMEASKQSNSRYQEAYITLDKVNHSINLNFYNDLDWENLK